MSEQFNSRTALRMLCRTDESADLIADRIEQLQREIAEQCVLLGKGGEREYTLLGKVGRLERENAALVGEVSNLRNKIACLEGGTRWLCTCGGTKLVGTEKLERENAALREDKERLGKDRAELRSLLRYALDQLDWHDVVAEGVDEIRAKLREGQS